MKANRIEPLSGMSSMGSSLPSVSGSITPPRGGYQNSFTTEGRVRVPQRGGSDWGEDQNPGRSPSPTNTNLSEYWARSTSEHPAALGKRGFHKIGAYKPPVSERAMHQIQREQLQKAQAELAVQEDSDVDEDWEL